MFVNVLTLCVPQQVEAHDKSAPYIVCYALPVCLLCPFDKGTNRSLPVTARSLETLIRLASAHAKARLSHKVEGTDAVKAVELMSFALYHETASSREEPDKTGCESEELRTNTNKRNERDAVRDEDNDNARYVSLRPAARRMLVAEIGKCPKPSTGTPVLVDCSRHAA